VLADQGEQAPCFRYAVEVVLAAILEPKVRAGDEIFAMFDTSTSPGPASAAMRATIETAMPPILSSAISHSPACWCKDPDH
jgi:hypothetical protein